MNNHEWRKHTRFTFGDFNYRVAPEQFAGRDRESSEDIKLVVVNAITGEVRLDRYVNIGTYFNTGDTLIWNNTGVSPSRLDGCDDNGVLVSICFLMTEDDAGPTVWDAIVLAEGEAPTEGTFKLDGNVVGDFLGKRQDFDAQNWIKKDKYSGYRGLVRLHADEAFLRDALNRHGKYMHPAYSEWEMDPVTLNPLRTDRLGGVLVSEPARRFTKEMLSSFTARGINSVDVSLRMAFAYHPQVPATSLDDYALNPEEYEISTETAAQLRQTLSGSGRVFSIGTSTVRVLETLQCPTRASRGRSNIFIRPDTDIRHVDCLLTGLHNPMSTHVMMATAFGGRELVLKACQCAADEGYRFGVHGDVMLILNQRKRALCNCADIG